MDSPYSSSTHEKSTRSENFLHIMLINFGHTYSLEIRLSHSVITETDLIDAIQAINAQEMVRVQEFTAVLDDREFPSAVGFFLEIHEDAMSTPTILFWTYNSHII